MRYAGPMRLGIKGNEALAKRHLGLARAQMGRMMALMKSLGVNQYVFRKTYPKEGVYIETYVAFPNVITARIVGVGVSEASVTILCEFGGFLVKYQDDTPAWRDRYMPPPYEEFLDIEIGEKIVQAGNHNWFGEYDGQRMLLSWNMLGDERYRAAPSSLSLYINGCFYTNALAQIRGAAIVGNRIVVATSNQKVYDRPFKRTPYDPSDNGLYDQETNPNGWKVTGTIPYDIVAGTGVIPASANGKNWIINFPNSPNYATFSVVSGSSGLSLDDIEQEQVDPGYATLDPEDFEIDTYDYVIDNNQSGSSENVGDEFTVTSTAVGGGAIGIDFTSDMTNESVYAHDFVGNTKVVVKAYDYAYRSNNISNFSKNGFHYGSYIVNSLNPYDADTTGPITATTNNSITITRDDLESFKFRVGGKEFEYIVSKGYASGSWAGNSSYEGPESGGDHYNIAMHTLSDYELADLAGHTVACSQDETYLQNIEYRSVQNLDARYDAGVLLEVKFSTDSHITSSSCFTNNQTISETLTSRVVIFANGQEFVLWEINLVDPSYETYILYRSITPFMVTEADWNQANPHFPFPNTHDYASAYSPFNFYAEDGASRLPDEKVIIEKCVWASDGTDVVCYYAIRIYGELYEGFKSFKSNAADKLNAELIDNDFNVESLKAV